MSLLNRKEISKLIGVHHLTVYRWTRSGVIPSYKCGRLLRYDLQEVLEALKQHNITNVSIPEVCS
jgi:excisionase family DNA binding protein